MNRAEFLKGCLGVCGVTLLSQALKSCATLPQINVEDSGAGYMRIPLAQLVGPLQNNWLLINERNKIPVLLKRNKEGVFSALELKCTHQGVPLQLHGEVLSCSAHGSEFDLNGTVLEGPAVQPLTVLKTQIENENMFIYTADNY